MNVAVQWSSYLVELRKLITKKKKFDALMYVFLRLKNENLLVQRQKVGQVLFVHKFVFAMNLKL